MTSPQHVPFNHRLLIELCLTHLSQFCWRGPGLLAISRDGIVPVFEDLDRRGIRVLGLDGFEFEGMDIYPQLDLIYDVDRSPSHLTPGKVIETWPDDIWIEVTIGDIP